MAFVDIKNPAERNKLIAAIILGGLGAGGPLFCVWTKLVRFEHDGGKPLDADTAAERFAGQGQL